MGLLSRLLGKSDEPRVAEPAVRTVTPRNDLAVVYRSEYLPPDQEAAVFVLGPEGLPTGRLVRERDRLVIVPDTGRGMVNPASSRLYSLGIYSFRVRGAGFHERALRAGDFRPGARLRLVREPDNEFDPNAVAVYAGTGREPVGYVNKLNAKRIAGRLDAGEELEAISTRGGGCGEDAANPWVLVATPPVLAHLSRAL